MDCFDVSSTTTNNSPTDFTAVLKSIDETVIDGASSTSDIICDSVMLPQDDLANLDTSDILDSGAGVMDCLGDLSPAAGFDLPSIETDDSVLPVYGPFAEFEAPAPVETDVLDLNSVPGVCGLRNLGNTCFMNAGLQCLINNKIIRTYFAEIELDELKGPLSLKFAELMRKVWSGSYSTIHLGEFKETFGNLHTQFRNFRQHDCQEFLALLLDTMHEELNASNQQKDSPSNILKSSEMEVSSTSIVQKDCDMKSLDTPTASDGVSSTSDLQANNVKLALTNTAKTPSQVESSTALYEKNTEKMADLLINNNKRDIALKASELDFLCNSDTCDTSSNVNERVLEKNELASKVNSSKVTNVLAGGPSLRDLIKDTKTWNTNVLVSEEEPNNLFKFDSEKFPKMDNNRLQETVDNLGACELGLSKERGGGGLKRVKITNILHDDSTPEKNQVESHKRMKVEDKVASDVEAAGDELSEGGSSEHSVSEGLFEGDCQELLVAEEIRRAYSAWYQYKSLNRSIIVDIFHGQFRSSVVCNQCNHNSITYEPFMYLPVFLPHTLEKQLVVTYVPCNGSAPTRYLLGVNKYDRIVKIREALLKVLEVPAEEILLAEVCQNHISRILDENQSIRRVNDSSRSIYAFEVGCQDSPSNAIDLTTDGLPSVVEVVDIDLPSPSAPPPVGPAQFHPCAICLEELPDCTLQLHPACECILCNNCIEVSCKHYGGNGFICPVCSTPVTPADDFVSLGGAGGYDFKISTLPIPLVLRNDASEGARSLVGHPGLIKVPSSLPAEQLWATVDRTLPCLANYTLLLVDGQGLGCSRCSFAAHCSGCPVPRSGTVQLLPSDTLAVRWTDLAPQQITSASRTLEHKSMRQTRHKQQLDIYDCLEYFSERESLDEDSPWYCPVCRRNQQATKSLSVWKFPDVLIIYLKRFVFHNFVSIKVEEKVSYPVEGLDLSSFSSGPLQEELIYDLQATVCHFGGVSAGHYTSYSKHAVSDEWYSFNDETVKREAPNTDDASSEYIFFYQKR